MHWPFMSFSKSSFRLPAVGVRELGMKNLVLFALGRPIWLLMAVLASASNGGPGAAGPRQLIV